VAARIQEGAVSQAAAPPRGEAATTPDGRAPAGRPGGRARRLLSRVVPPVLALLVVLTLWQLGLFERFLGLQTYIVPEPATIFSQFTSDWSAIWQAQWTTLVEAITGYVFGAVLGFALAVLVTATGLGRRFLPGVAGAINAVPIVATAPISVLYLGYGSSSKIAIVTVLTASVMLLNANKGLNAVADDQVDLMHSYAATRWQVIVKLRAPSSLPFVFTALKYNVTLALVAAIIAEFFGGFGGVGIEMVQALSGFSLTLVWAAMVLVGVLGIAWYQIVSATEWLATRSRPPEE
jgi:NitT/TauT family transport system permease protein